MAAEWSAIERAILQTVLYASLFEYPLTIDELCRTLLGCRANAAALARAFDGSPALQARIDHRDGVFFPRGCHAWIAQRERREARSLAFLRRHRRLLAVIAALPYVRTLALSGSVAALNADRRADLDLFVITKGRRAWTVTLAVVVLSKLLGRRRVVCLNFALSDTALALEQQDMFAANQVIQLRPLAGADGYDAFLAANPFVRRFYPNFQPQMIGLPIDSRPAPWILAVRRTIEAVLDVPSRAIEAACRQMYGWHLARRARAWRSPGAVRLDPARLKLHTRSHRDSVLERFEALCRDADAEVAPSSVPRPRHVA